MEPKIKTVKLRGKEIIKLINEVTAAIIALQKQLILIKKKR